MNADELQAIRERVMRSSQFGWRSSGFYDRDVSRLLSEVDRQRAALDIAAATISEQARQIAALVDELATAQGHPDHYRDACQYAVQLIKTLYADPEHRLTLDAIHYCQLLEGALSAAGLLDLKALDATGYLRMADAADTVSEITIDNVSLKIVQSDGTLGSDLLTNCDYSQWTEAADVNPAAGEGEG